MTPEEDAPAPAPAPTFPLPPFPGRVRIDAAILELAGPDAERFLNGQVTCDVRALVPGATAVACITNHKGKLDAAPVFVRRTAPDRFLVDGPPDLRDALAARLDRYLIADDCELRDRSDDFALVHGPAVPAGDDAAIAAGPNHFRFGSPTWDVIVPAGDLPPGTIDPAGDEAARAALEFLRVAHGIPAWGTDASPDRLAPEIPFLRDHAISYTKGCYIGQEVISRIKSVGRVNQTLALLLPARDAAAGQPPPSPGDPVFAIPDASDPKEAGHITSVATRPDSLRNRTSPPFAALAIVHRAHAEIGSLLHAGSAKNMLSCRLEIGNTPDVASDR